MVSIILIGVLGGGATALGLSTFLQQLAVAFSGLALLLLTAFQWHDLDELGRQINATAYFWSGMLTWTLVLVFMALSWAGTPDMGPAFPVFASALLLIAVHALLHGLFTAALMGNVRAERLARLILPFFLAAALVIVALSLFPMLSTGLGAALQ